jgi:hypothetical protein
VRAVKKGCGGRRTIVAYPEVNFRSAVSKRKIARWKASGPKRILKTYRITRKVCKRDDSYVRGVVELTYVLDGRSYGYRRYVATRNKRC